MKKNISLIVPLLVVVLSFIYLYILIEKLPFYWEDFEWLKHSQTTLDSFQQIINPLKTFNTPLFDRPVQVLVIRLLNSIFGESPLPFYFFKIIIWLIVGLVIYFSVLKYTRSIYFGIIGMILTMYYSGNIQSAIWICDFLLLGMFFFILGVILFHNNFLKKNGSIYSIILLVAFVVLGYRTKANVMVLPLTFVIYALTKEGRELFKNRGFLMMLFLVSMYVGLNLLLSQGEGTSVIFQHIDWKTFLINVLFTFSPFIILHLGYLIYIYFKSSQSKVIINYLLIVSIVSFIFLFLLPSFERRYFGIVFIPVAGLYVMLLHFLIDESKINRTLHKWMATSFVLLFLLSNTLIVFNARLNLGMHVAKENAVRWIEENYQQKNIYYSYWREYFYTSNTKNHYELIEYSKNNREDYIMKGRYLIESKLGDILCLDFPLPDKKPMQIFEGTNSSIFDYFVPLMSKFGKSTPKMFIYDSLTVKDFEYIHSSQSNKSPY